MSHDLTDEGKVNRVMSGLNDRRTQKCRNTAAISTKTKNVRLVLLSLYFKRISKDLELSGTVLGMALSSDKLSFILSYLARL